MSMHNNFFSPSFPCVYHMHTLVCVCVGWSVAFSFGPICPRIGVPLGHISNVHGDVFTLEDDKHVHVNEFNIFQP